MKTFQDSQYRTVLAKNCNFYLRKTNVVLNRLNLVLLYILSANIGTTLTISFFLAVNIDPIYAISLVSISQNLDESRFTILTFNPDEILT